MSQIPEAYSTEVFEESRFETSREWTLRGEKMTLRTVAEDTVFYAPDGHPEATLFSVSYERADREGPRPVMFLWNGGPGSATSTLHLECFGPWGIARDGEGKPVYGLTESEDCLLDICDLVFVDPAGVGLSRLLDPEKAWKYYSVDGDARSVAFMMIEWLRRRNRWDSPLYICGESYGTVRACRVLAELGRSPFSESRMVPGIPAAGVILVGLATSENLVETELTTAMMPAMAAACWYHDPEKQKAGSQEAFVAEAWRYAQEELMPVLSDKDGPGEPKKQEMAVRLAAYTGMPETYWLDHGLRIASPRDFMTRALPGYTLDLYDARMKTPADQPYNEIGSADNMPLKVMNGQLLPMLGVQTRRLYYTGNINIPTHFNYETEKLEEPFRRTHLQCLRDAMRANPGMKTLFASGLYDLCTHAGNTRYAVGRAELPMERVRMREYPGGHGVYSSREGRAAFLEDVRRLIAEQEEAGT